MKEIESEEELQSALVFYLSIDIRKQHLKYVSVGERPNLKK